MIDKGDEEKKEYYFFSIIFLPSKEFIFQKGGSGQSRKLDGQS